MLSPPSGGLPEATRSAGASLTRSPRNPCRPRGVPAGRTLVGRLGIQSDVNAGGRSLALMRGKEVADAAGKVAAQVDDLGKYFKE